MGEPLPIDFEMIRRYLRSQMNIGKHFPFARWSVLRMGLGMKRLLKEWQVGDGREAKLAEYITKHATPGDLEDAIRVVDEYAYNESFLINVGEVKGKILDDAVRRAKAKTILDLGRTADTVRCEWRQPLRKRKFFRSSSMRTMPRSHAAFTAMRALTTG